MSPREGRWSSVPLGAIFISSRSRKNWLAHNIISSVCIVYCVCVLSCMCARRWDRWIWYSHPRYCYYITTVVLSYSAQRPCLSYLLHLCSCSSFCYEKSRECKWLAGDLFYVSIVFAKLFGCGCWCCVFIHIVWSVANILYMLPGCCIYICACLACLML